MSAHPALDRATWRHDVRIDEPLHWTDREPNRRKNMK
jgi:hypothetical protein